MENCNKVCISLSGGLDSTCLLMHYLAKGFSVKAFSFDYGQKHDIELKISGRTFIELSAVSRTFKLISILSFLNLRLY